MFYICIYTIYLHIHQSLCKHICLSVYLILGVSFPTSFQSLINQIPLALEVYAEGVERYIL